MMRSAGLKIVARPHQHILIAEPDRYFGTYVQGDLVFPKYGKRGGALQPGPQRVDPRLWSELCRRAAEFRKRQAEEVSKSPAENR